ncbi:unnamed protein product [Calypogeia fissa]
MVSNIVEPIFKAGGDKDSEKISEMVQFQHKFASNHAREKSNFGPDNLRKLDKMKVCGIQPREEINLDYNHESLRHS